LTSRGWEAAPTELQEPRQRLFVRFRDADRGRFSSLEAARERRLTLARSSVTFTHVGKL
jgi:hypothetical protein